MPKYKLKDEYRLKNKIPLIRISESFIKNNIDEVYKIFGTEEYLKNVFEIDRYGKEYEDFHTKAKEKYSFSVK